MEYNVYDVYSDYRASLIVMKLIIPARAASWGFNPAHQSGSAGDKRVDLINKGEFESSTDGHFAKLSVTVVQYWPAHRSFSRRPGLII